MNLTILEPTNVTQFHLIENHVTVIRNVLNSSTFDAYPSPHRQEYRPECTIFKLLQFYHFVFHHESPDEPAANPYNFLTVRSEKSSVNSLPKKYGRVIFRYASQYIYEGRQFFPHAENITGFSGKALKGRIWSTIEVW